MQKSSAIAREDGEAHIDKIKIYSEISRLHDFHIYLILEIDMYNK